jgi:hypothetical protein
MSNFNQTPILSNTATTGVPLASTPMMPGATATTVLPQTGLNSGLGGGLLGGNHSHLSKQERKALKHQNKALKHQHGHHQHGVPLMGNHATTGTALGGVAPIVHGATNVIQHQPIIERSVVVERPVEVRREHHIQPVIHEREHQIQPVIRTEITTERRDMVTERDVMLPAVVEQPHLTSTGMLHQTTTDHRGIMPATGTGMGAHHATIGQKIKGTVKEVQGSLTHNPMKKEEGRLLKQGIEPSTAGLGTGSTLGNTGTTTRF